MTGVAVSGYVSVAFGAGVATFFSPCAYALLPGYVGYYASAAADDDRSVLAGSLLRGLAGLVGVVAVFGLVGLGVVLVRPVVEPAIRVLEPVVGLAFVVLGLAVALGRVPAVHVLLPARRTSIAGFTLFGAAYAVAAAGCVGPFLLAIVVRAVTLPPAAAGTVLGAFVLGFGSVFLAATVAIGVGRDALLSRFGSRNETLVRAAGVLLVLAGLGQLAIALAV
jgi:cytochrome c-type biogenesis protein